jgi:hypothetical protein
MLNYLSHFREDWPLIEQSRSVCHPSERGKALGFGELLGRNWRCMHLKSGYQFVRVRYPSEEYLDYQQRRIMVAAGQTIPNGLGGAILQQEASVVAEHASRIVDSTQTLVVQPVKIRLLMERFLRT